MNIILHSIGDFVDLINLRRYVGVSCESTRFHRSGRDKQVREMEENMTTKKWSERCSGVDFKYREATSEESSCLWKLAKGKKQKTKSKKDFILKPPALKAVLQTA